jgi:toxin ParE1/3/4
MIVRWTLKASSDRSSIYHYIEVDNETAAAKNDLRISDAAISLLDFPRKGRFGRIQGTREWVVDETP